MRLLNQQSQSLQLEKKILQKFKGETKTFYLYQLKQIQNQIIKYDKRLLSNHQNLDKMKILVKTLILNFKLICYLKELGLSIQLLITQIVHHKLRQHYKSIKMLIQKNIEEELQNGVIIQDKVKLFIKYHVKNIIQLLIQYKQLQLCVSIKVVTIKELLELTNIEKTELENCLIPFVYLKVLIRQKQDIDEFNDADEIIQINVAFNSKGNKMRMLPNPKMQPIRQQIKQENVEEQQKLEQIYNEREFFIDSQLIRLMKTKKTVNHHELVENCQQTITLLNQMSYLQKREQKIYQKESMLKEMKKIGTFIIT